MFDFTADEGGVFLVQRTPAEKNPSRLAKILAQECQALAVDLTQMIGRQAGQVVATRVRAESAARFIAAAAAEGIELEHYPMWAYLNPSKNLPARRLRFEETGIVVEPVTPGQEETTLAWDRLLALRLGRVQRQESHYVEVSVDDEDTTLERTVEDIDHLVAEVLTTEARLQLLPGKLTYYHLQDRAENSADNYRRTLAEILERAPGCHREEATQAWCRKEPSKLPTFRDLAEFKRAGEGELQLLPQVREHLLQPPPPPAPKVTPKQRPSPVAPVSVSPDEVYRHLAERFGDHRGSSLVTFLTVTAVIMAVGVFIYSYVWWNDAFDWEWEAGIPWALLLSPVIVLVLSALGIQQGGQFFPNYWEVAQELLQKPELSEPGIRLATALLVAALRQPGCPREEVLASVLGADPSLDRSLAAKAENQLKALTYLQEEATLIPGPAALHNFQR